jgi:hypothetical protein
MSFNKMYKIEDKKTFLDFSLLKEAVFKWLNLFFLKSLFTFLISPFYGFLFNLFDRNFFVTIVYVIILVSGVSILYYKYLGKYFKYHFILLVLLNLTGRYSNINHMMRTKSEVLHSNTYADTIETLNYIAISIIDICFLYQITKEEKKRSKLAYEIILKAMSSQSNICFKIQKKLKIYSYKIACSDIKELTEKDLILNNSNFCCLRDMQNLRVFSNDEASVNLEWDKEYANLQEKNTKETNDKKLSCNDSAKKRIIIKVATILALSILRVLIMHIFYVMVDKRIEIPTNPHTQTPLNIINMHYTEYKDVPSECICDIANHINTFGDDVLYNCKSVLSKETILSCYKYISSKINNYKTPDYYPSLIKRINEEEETLIRKVNEEICSIVPRVYSIKNEKFYKTYGQSPVLANLFKSTYRRSYCIAEMEKEYTHVFYKMEYKYKFIAGKNKDYIEITMIVCYLAVIFYILRDDIRKMLLVPYKYIKKTILQVYYFIKNTKPQQLFYMLGSLCFLIYILKFIVRLID